MPKESFENVGFTVLVTIGLLFFVAFLAQGEISGFGANRFCSNFWKNDGVSFGNSGVASSLVVRLTFLTLFYIVF